MYHVVIIINSTVVFEGDVQKFDSAVVKLSDIVETMKLIACSCGVLPNGNDSCVK